MRYGNINERRHQLYVKVVETMMSTLFFFIPKGLFETVKKIGWVPDIHVHGWMAAMLPIYMKHYYKKRSVVF
jgi:glycogen synthase